MRLIDVLPQYREHEVPAHQPFSFTQVCCMFDALHMAYAVGAEIVRRTKNEGDVRDTQLAVELREVFHDHR